MVDRIRLLLQAKQLTPTQFADTIGIARPIISHILSGRNKPSLEVVQKILAAFPDLAMAWLLSGTEPMWAVPVAPAAAVAPVPDVVPPAAATSVVEQASAAIREDAPAQQSAPLPPKANRLPKPLAPVTGATPAARSNTAAMPPRFRVGVPAPQNPPLASAHSSTSPAQPTLGSAASDLQQPAMADTPLAPIAATPPQPTAPVTAALDPAMALLAMPGKAIRRIVIFYQDGSFADYQPE